MGNSTRTLQSVVDFVRTIPAVRPILTSTPGYADQPAKDIASAVMTEFLSDSFPWKWNRRPVTPFYPTANQTDYPTLAEKSIGWLERATAVDINSTSFPRPSWKLEAVRDLDEEGSSLMAPAKICWLYNWQMNLPMWPGPATIYVLPETLTTTANLQPRSIRDTNGNILILTVEGVTGDDPPLVDFGTPPGTVVIDGTASWTVADPDAQGYRIDSAVGSISNLILIRPQAQGKPVRFTSLSQKLDPIPDDFSKWFEDGFIAYSKQHSEDPTVQAGFDAARAKWLQGLAQAARSGDREKENFGFYPDHNVMDTGIGFRSIGPADPYRRR